MPVDWLARLQPDEPAKLISLVGRALRRRSPSPWTSDEILRAELFSIERLEQHAASLAVAQRVTKRPIARRTLGVRLRDNEAVLLAAYRDIAAATGEGRAISPAAEWLLDNYHIVEEQIREIREDLPPSFYRLLPKLADGPLNGYPRVLGVAWAFVAHTDSRFDPETLRSFVRAYQRVQPLTIGELWAVAITLRIVLVENLRRAAARIVSSRAARQEADALADRLLGVNGHAAEPDALIGRERGSRILLAGICSPTRPTPAGSGPESDARIALAGGTLGRAGNNLGRGRARRASAPRRLERDRTEHHHEHAVALGC